jgi:hypothetical protein
MDRARLMILVGAAALSPTLLGTSSLGAGDSRAGAARSPADGATSGAKEAALSAAVAVAGDLALLPSGKVVSVSTNETLSAWGEMTRLVGDGDEGCGVLKNGGAVRCWARDATRRVVVLSIDGVGPSTDVAGSLLGGCALRAGGTVLCWDRGEPRPPDGLVRRDAPLKTPDFDAPQPAPPLTRPLRLFPVPKLNHVIAIAGGADGCAIEASGAVSCWGYRWTEHNGRAERAYSRDPVPVRGLRHARQIADDGGARCAVDAAGGASCWGPRFRPAVTTSGLFDGPVDDEPRPVKGVADAVGISVRGNAACVVTKTGQVACWGASSCAGKRNSVAVRTITGIADAVSVSVTPSGYCAVRRGGGLVCKGACPP